MERYAWTEKRKWDKELDNKRSGVGRISVKRLRIVFSFQNSS